MKSKAWTEKFMLGVFLIAACTSVLAVALICIFFLQMESLQSEKSGS